MYCLIYISVLFSLCLLALPGTNAVSECPIQHSCNETKLTASEVVPNMENETVEEYCEHRHKMNMTGRCCILNNTIIGMDMRYCEVKQLNISLPVFSDIEILDLRDNDFDKFKSADLVGLLKLNILYLPLHISCPGGPNCWNETSTLNNMTSCIHQNDPCASLNISCGEPENANCKHTGPGSAKCECSPGYFGYKCLNRGYFPNTVFICGVIIPTVVLSIALWFVQGRDPYKLAQS